MENLSGSGCRLSRSCFVSVSDSEEDIYLCENAADFNLRFGALPSKRSGANDKRTQTALLKHLAQSFHSLHIDQFILEMQNQVAELRSRFSSSVLEILIKTLKRAAEEASWFRRWITSVFSPVELWDPPGLQDDVNNEYISIWSFRIHQWLFSVIFCLP